MPALIHRRPFVIAVTIALGIFIWEPVMMAATDQPFPQPPLPDTISPAARAALAPLLAAPPPGEMPVETMRAFAETIQKALGAEQLKKYRVRVEDAEIGGVSVRVFTPEEKAAPAHTVLLNLHGGGFQVDSGSLTENIPIAALTGLKVIAVRYRLSPEHPFPAPVDDAEAVYRQLLKTYTANRIGVYGTSAGAVLGAELMVRLRADNLPRPAALGFFSGSADLARIGDSERYLPGLNGKSSIEMISPYVAGSDPLDPRLSPLYGDLKDFPPTLVVTSTRDILLSQSTIFHRALVRARVPAELLVFEAMPHAFWAYVDAPESTEALEAMATFLRTKVGAH
jgi:epsilon-lactone hydrolase